MHSTEYGDSAQALWHLVLCPSQEIDLAPYGLLSLWDMQKFYVQHCLDIGSRIQEVFAILQIAESYGEHEDGRSLSHEETLSLFDLLGKIEHLCMQIPLPTSHEVVKRNLSDPPKTFREWQRVVEVIEIEMKGIFFLSIPPHRAIFYERDGLLNPETRDAFPQLTQEMWNAGSCFALELPTACVFHCMRALEHALRAMAERVSLTWTSEQWHTIIGAVEAKIRDLRGSKKSAERNEELNFLSEAAKEFFYFKDGWRNHVSHNKIVYEEAQAKRILEHVASFADILATKLKEGPDPIQASATHDDEATSET